MTRLLINLSSGTVEVEGSEDFVKAIYDDLRQTGFFAFGKREAPEEVGVSEEAVHTARTKRATAKRSGPSCASRIVELKEEGFFSELRDAKGISDALSAKGNNYEGKHIAAALISLTKAGKLRRLKRDGGWMYQNP